jgi:hypothetical protein
MFIYNLMHYYVMVTCRKLLNHIYDNIVAIKAVSNDTNEGRSAYHLRKGLSSICMATLLYYPSYQ